MPTSPLLRTRIAAILASSSLASHALVFVRRYEPLPRRTYELWAWEPGFIAPLTSSLFFGMLVLLGFASGAFAIYLLACESSWVGVWTGVATMVLFVVASGYLETRGYESIYLPELAPAHRFSRLLSYSAAFLAGSSGGSWLMGRRYRRTVSGNSETRS